MLKRIFPEGFSRNTPYSPAVEAAGYVYTSGQVPVDAENKVVEGTFEEQVRVTMDRLKKVVEAAGSSLDKCVKITIYLKKMSDYAEFNKVYSEYFASEEFPARTCIAAGDLPLGAPVEIEAVAVL
jgi:2-iminobutanoate/2-iminopropanoate deaminase